MEIPIKFNLPFPWCDRCKSFDPEITVLYAADQSALTEKTCTHCLICQDNNQAWSEWFNEKEEK